MAFYCQAREAGRTFAGSLGLAQFFSARCPRLAALSFCQGSTSQSARHTASPKTQQLSLHLTKWKEGVEGGQQCTETSPCHQQPEEEEGGDECCAPPAETLPVLRINNIFFLL